MSQKAKQYLTARKKHHIIYKTTCLVTSRYYIGMHSTDNLDDGYMGSGKRLWRSIQKHGLDQHRCEIIEHLPTRESLRIREHELVNEELLADTMCMNLALGGGHIYNTAQPAYVKVKQKDGIKRFWESASGLALRERYRQMKRPQSAVTRAKAKSTAKVRMARMKADGSWDAVVAKNKAAHAGKVLSAEHKASIGAGGLRYKELHGKKQFSEQAVANIAASLIGNDRNKKVWTLLDINSQQTFQIENVSKWCREQGLDSSLHYIVDPIAKTKLYVVLERQAKNDATKNERNAAKRLRRNLRSKHEAPATI